MIDKEDSIEYIEKLFGDGDLTNGGLNIAVVCPICKKQKGNDYYKKKLVIRTDDHRVHCWVCGYKSKNLSHLVRNKVKLHGFSILKEYDDRFLGKLGGSKRLRCVLLNASNVGIDLFEDYLEDVEAEVEIEPAKLPEGFIFLAECAKETNNKYIQRHLSYLKQERGISKISDLWYWKFCVAPPSDKEFNNRIILPSFDRDGNLNYFSGRTIKEHYYKYWNSNISKKSIIFNEYLIDWAKPLILVEGPFDLVKTRLLGPNVVPMLGKELDDSYRLAQKIIENKTPIIIATDPEETKQKLKMSEYFSGYGVSVSTLEYPEWVEDIGSLTEVQVKELFETNVRKYDTIFELRNRITRIM